MQFKDQFASTMHAANASESHHSAKKHGINHVSINVCVMVEGDKREEITGGIPPRNCSKRVSMEKSVNKSRVASSHITHTNVCGKQESRMDQINMQVWQNAANAC